MKTLTRSIVLVSVLTLIGGLAHAQSDKYQRPGKKSTEAVAPAIGAAAAAKKDDKAPKVEAKSEKVDIQQIESEYWQSKDTEFHVVQSRKFAKEKRPYVNLGYGMIINDNFNKGGQFSLSGGYYYQEQKGFEIFYDSFSAEDSKVIKEVLSLSGGPTYARPLAQYGATWNWMPIYGKVSVLDKSIVYFDMGLHLGLGMAEYAPMIENGVGSKQSKEAGKETAPMLIMDISQQFFLNEKWALRFDIKNRFYKRDLKNFNNGAARNTDTEHNIDAVLGFTYFFN